MHCPWLPPLLKECWEVSMSFLPRISQTQSMFLFVQQSSLFWNQFSHFKDHVYSKSSVLKWNQRCPFLKRSFENQAFWSKIQHTLFKIWCHLIVMYFKNRNWHVVRLKWLFFFMVLCIHFKLYFWVHLWMVCDEVTSLWISKIRCSTQNLSFIKKGCFFS
jgi:hypothetical protein